MQIPFHASTSASLGIEVELTVVDRRTRHLVNAATDLFVDMGGDHSWLDEAAHCGLCILIDCEPGFTQMKMASRLEAGETLPDYDAYFTPGRNVGTARSSVPLKSRWSYMASAS